MTAVSSQAATTTAAADPDEVLTPRQAAAILGIGYKTALEWIDDGILRATKIRGQYFIRRRWLDQLIDEGEPAA